jgi:aspartate aminotransferase
MVPASMAGDASSSDGRALLSRRVADTLLGSKESWTRRMFELAGQLRGDGGGPVYDLSLGNPSLEPPDVWRHAIVELLEDEPPGMHRYMTNAGFAEVRAFIAEREGRRYGLPVTAEDVTMTVGAAGAVNVLMRSMLEPGDEVVVPAPYFSEYDHYCANVEATLVPVSLGADFALDVDRIEAALSPKARWILLNSPNNPTGVVYERSSLRALAAMLERVNAGRERPIFVIEDSPYRDLVHDGSDVPAMISHYPHTILLTSHSKDLGLAGERIGYLVISPNAAGRQLIGRAAAFCNRVLGFVNAPALMQRVLPRVLNDPNGRVDVAIYARRCARMTEGLRALGFSLPDPRAGFFLFPGLPDRLRDAEGGDVALTEALLDRRTIVVPGIAFGAPGYLRLSMATDDEAVDGALAAFNEVCA